MKLSLLSVAAALFLDLALAHGPALSPSELQKRDNAHLHARRSFAACQHSLTKRSAGLRREEFVRRHKQKRDNIMGGKNLEKRQSPTTTTQKDVATGTNTASPFSGIPTCVLAPESMQGPYYLPAELIRNDIRETQAGVDLLLDVQVFDAKSCKVLPNVMVDFWHANALGVYGGYQSEGTSGDTWLRGLAETDSEGVVQITSKWPGHYGGRAVHIHIMAHINGSISTDGNKRTYHGGSNPFVGQLFFPMSNIDEVEKVDPYSKNTNSLVRNEDDSIFNRQTRAVNGYDGLVDLRTLGSNVQDGYLAWISIGIDIASTHDTGFPDNAGSNSGASTTTRTGNTVGSPTSSSTRAATAGADNTGGAQGVGSAVTAGKIVAVGMGVMVAAVAFWG